MNGTGIIGMPFWKFQPMTGWSCCFGCVIRQHHSRNVRQRNRGPFISSSDVFSMCEALGLSHSKGEEGKERREGGE